MKCWWVYLRNEFPIDSRKWPRLKERIQTNFLIYKKRNQSDDTRFFNVLFFPEHQLVHEGSQKPDPLAQQCEVTKTRIKIKIKENNFNFLYKNI